MPRLAVEALTLAIVSFLLLRFSFARLARLAKLRPAVRPFDAITFFLPIFVHSPLNQHNQPLHDSNTRTVFASDIHPDIQASVNNKRQIRHVVDAQCGPAPQSQRARSTARTPKMGSLGKAQGSCHISRLSTRSTEIHGSKNIRLLKLHRNHCILLYGQKYSNVFGGLITGLLSPSQRPQ